MRSIIAITIAACAPGTPPIQRPAGAELVRGPADTAAGRVLVITATCGALEARCPDSWAPAVDQIVLGGLEFRGYATIDPATLRKDERSRHETIDDRASSDQSSSSASAREGRIIGVIPILGATGTDSSSLTVSSAHSKTVMLEGASFEDLRYEDRRALMQLAGAGTVATTRVVVGANYGDWNAARQVEVVVKLAAADTGAMRWSARCMASSRELGSVEAAIEHAARCAADAFTLAP